MPPLMIYLFLATVLFTEPHDVCKAQKLTTNIHTGVIAQGPSDEDMNQLEELIYETVG